ncbi:MAG: hypothetical protein WBO04_07135 [Steroidobacteraceae bacterium]
MLLDRLDLSAILSERGAIQRERGLAVGPFSFIAAVVGCLWVSWSVWRGGQC